MENLTESSLIDKLDNQIELSQAELEFLVHSGQFRVEENYIGDGLDSGVDFFESVCKVGERFYRISWVYKTYPKRHYEFPEQPYEVEPVEKTVIEYVPLQVD